MVVVVPGEVPDPDRTVLAALARAPDAAGVDALCRTEAVVDALVELDGAGRVVGHLDRDRHVSPALPQVVVAGWWPRLAGSIRARLESGEPLDLVALVAGLGGTVAAFGEPGSEGA